MLRDLGWLKQVEITDQANRTAQLSTFGVLKTANESTLKEYKFSLPSVSFNFNVSETPSGSLGTWEIVDSSLKVHSGASANSGIVLESKEVHVYSVAHGMIGKFSVILGDSGITGNIREWGMFDDDNGVFIRLNGTQYEFVLRNKGNDTVVSADNWDIPITPDPNGHMWFIQYAWFGVSDFYLYYDGQLVYTHPFRGTSTEPSMATPDLKLSLANYNITNTSDVSMLVNACSVSQEGLDKIRLASGEYDVKVSPEGELLVRKTAQVLLDEHFINSSLNLYRWVDNVSGSGTISIDESMCSLKTTTANGDSAEIYTTQGFVHIFSQTYSFRCGIILDHLDLDNNTKIWGMRNPVTNDGWYFRLINGDLEVCTEHQGIVTNININEYKPTDGYVHRYDAIYRNYRVLFYIDDALVYGATAVSEHLYDNEELKPYFRNYNTGITTEISHLHVEGIALFDDTSSGVQISGVDDDGLIHTVAVSPTRRLLVSQEPPSPPPETTRVKQSAYTDMSGTIDTDYVIPNGETVVLQRFSAGAEDDSPQGNVIELWHDPDATGNSMVLIDVLFSSGASDQHDLNDAFLGDGTAQIKMRRRRLSGEAKLVYGAWEGYY